MQEDIHTLKRDVKGLKEDVGAIKEDIEIIKEDAEITRTATNTLLDGAERRKFRYISRSRDSGIQARLRRAFLFLPEAGRSVGCISLTSQSTFSAFSPARC